MIHLYSDLNFFLAILAVTLLFVLIQLGRKREKAYSWLVALSGLGLAIAVYGEHYKKPVVFFAAMGTALLLQKKKLIPTWLAVIATLTPLVVGKITTQPWLAMVGLSFATFRALDVLLFSEEDEKISPLLYATYLFCPLILLAGPMYRWQHFQRDISGGFNNIKLVAVIEGLELLLLGVVQKFMFAEVIYRFGLSNLPEDSHSIREMALTAIFYSTFLYFDFAGYSNMARGAGRMIGLDLPDNFNNPILAKNPQDFWRRWHISLSEWLRDVVFMPVYLKLSQRRFFSARRLLAQNIGVFLTLLIMGIWNGLERHYVVSGVLFGLYSVAYNTMVVKAKKPGLVAWAFQNRAICLSGRFLTLILCMLALYVFSGRSPI